MSEPEQPAAPSGHAGGLDSTRAVVLAIVFVVVALIALSSLTSDDGSKPNGQASVTTTTAPTRHKQKQATVDRAQVQVQVANGTTQSGIATTVTTTLQEQGWSTLPPVNATSTAPSTSIYYAGGRKAAGLQLARDMKLPKSVVQPLTTSVPVPGANGDDLVLLVGPDLKA